MNINSSKILTKEFLEKEYLINAKDIREITKETDCGYSTVNKYLTLYKILKRPMKETIKKLWDEGKFSERKKLKTKELDKILTREFLMEEYINKETPVSYISKNIGCNDSSIKRRLVKFNIPLREKGFFWINKSHNDEIKNKIKTSLKEYFTLEHRKKLSLLHGGNGEVGSYLSRYLRKEIYERDHFKCNLCGITEKEHISKFNERLSIHHIDYDENNNEPNNLISLCKSCHTKTNTYRMFYRQGLMFDLFITNRLIYPTGD